MIFTGFTFLLLSRLDIFMLDHYRSSSEVGIYNFVARISAQVLFVQQLLAVLFLPRLAKLMSEKKYALVTFENRRYLIISFISTLLISLFIYLVFRFGFFKTYFDIDFNIQIFLILVFGHCSYSLLSSSSYLLLYLHKEVYEYLNCTLIIVIGVLMNVWLIPIYGSIGAAIATTSAIVLGNIFEYLEVRYFMGKINENS